MEILERIKPLAVKDFVGSRPHIMKLQELLRDNTKHFICVLGPEGCGKTTLVNLLLQQYNFNVLDLNKDFTSNKEFTSVITSYCENVTIESFFNKKRKCVLVDGFETLIQNDRYLLTSLLTCLESIQKINGLLMIVSHNSEERRITDSKKNPEIIKLSYPQQRDCFAYLMNKDIGIDDEVLLKLVKEHKSSIRDIILNMHSTFTKDGMEYKDLSNFEIVKQLYSRGCNITNIEDQFKDDTNLISFMFYENIPEHICMNLDVPNDEKLTLYANLNENFIMSCVVESYVYDTGNFNFYDLINIVRLFGGVSMFQGYANKKKVNDFRMRFSQILSKVSHKNIMSKKIKSIIASSDMSYHNLYMLSDAVSSNKLKFKGSTDETNFVTTYDKYFT